MKAICACCSVRPEHEITDAKGRVWRFEMSNYFGPILLRKDGNPSDRQPGSRSAFWPAWNTWHEQHSRKAA